MLESFGSVMNILFRSEKVRLIREAEDAFYANDKVRCIDAIEQLYDLYDDDVG